MIGRSLIPYKSYSFMLVCSHSLQVSQSKSSAQKLNSWALRGFSVKIFNKDTEIIKDGVEFL